MTTMLVPWKKRWERVRRRGKEGRGKMKHKSAEKRRGGGEHLAAKGINYLRVGDEEFKRREMGGGGGGAERREMDEREASGK